MATHECEKPCVYPVLISSRCPSQRHLGLDDEPSWIVTTEVNRFIWPGPDIRLPDKSDTPLCGTIPAKLFDRVKLQISDNARAGQAVTVKRTE